MDVEHAEREEDWYQGQRSETEVERLDRQWASLLQELRVAQTGVQLLTGFLLTLPFQQRFDVLDDTVRGVYLTAVACSVASTVLLIAPVGMHRVLFRRHRLKSLVSSAHRMAYAGLLLLGLALTGATIVVFAAVRGTATGYTAGVIALVAFASFWVVLPYVVRRNSQPMDSNSAQR